MLCTGCMSSSQHTSDTTTHVKSKMAWKWRSSTFIYWVVTSLFPISFLFPPLFLPFPPFSFPLSPPLPDRVARAQSLTWSEGQPIKLVSFFFLICSFFFHLIIFWILEPGIPKVQGNELADACGACATRGQQRSGVTGICRIWTRLLKIKTSIKSGVRDPRWKLIETSDYGI